METENDYLATEKRKKSSKRSRSSSSCSEGENYMRNRRLKVSEVSLQSSNQYGSKRISDIDEHRASKSRKRTDWRKTGKDITMNRRSESGQSSSWSSSESEEHKKKKQKKKKKKRKKKKEFKKREKSKKKEKVGKRKDMKSGSQNDLEEESHAKGHEDDLLPGPKLGNSQEPKRRAMVPMTKEEYEKQQNKIRRVFDPDTGRERLVKGEGEIVEEIVSYERHKAINKLSTFGDGAAFQKSLGLNRYTDDKVYNRS